MSDIKESGYKTSDILSSLSTVLGKMSDEERKGMVKKTNGVFQINVKKEDGKEATWVIDMKTDGKVTKGPAKKADVTMNLSDDTFANLADGKLNGQRAFMTGALKVKGNVMLASKLDNVLKASAAKNAQAKL